MSSDQERIYRAWQCLQLAIGELVSGGGRGMSLMSLAKQYGARLGVTESDLRIAGSLTPAGMSDLVAPNTRIF